MDKASYDINLQEHRRLLGGGSSARVDGDGVVLRDLLDQVLLGKKSETAASQGNLTIPNTLSNTDTLICSTDPTHHGLCQHERTHSPPQVTFATIPLIRHPHTTLYYGCYLDAQTLRDDSWGDELPGWDLLHELIHGWLVEQWQVGELVVNLSLGPLLLIRHAETNRELEIQDRDKP